jgi:elongation factor P
MAIISTNEFKSGLKILIDGNPMVIIKNEFFKPGKGQAFSRVKLRNLKSRCIIEKTFKSGESVKVADVIETAADYSYFDGKFYVFIHRDTFEQYSVTEAVLGSSTKNWLKNQNQFTIVLFNSEVITIIPSNFVDLEVVDTDPGIRGDTTGSCTKPAVLETGVVVMVPLFVEQQDLIKVDTRTGEYVSRVKG